jgi:hypothetical protein
MQIVFISVICSVCKNKPFLIFKKKQWHGFGNNFLFLPNDYHIVILHFLYCFSSYSGMMKIILLVSIFFFMYFHSIYFIMFKEQWKLEKRYIDVKTLCGYTPLAGTFLSIFTEMARDECTHSKAVQKNWKWRFFERVKAIK